MTKYMIYHLLFDDAVSREAIKLFINRHLSRLEERMSSENNEGRWVEEEKCQCAIENLEFIDEYIWALPPVTPKPRWIPVSERLPENNGYYLVTEKRGRVCSYVFRKEGNSEEYWRRCADAWMPLPEPYKGGESE